MLKPPIHTHTHAHTIFSSMHSTEAAGCSPLRAGLQQAACCWTSSFFHTSLVLGGLYPPSCHVAILLATIHTCSSLPWQLAQTQISPLRLCTGDWHAHTLCSLLIRIRLSHESSASWSPLKSTEGLLSWRLDLGGKVSQYCKCEIGIPRLFF